MYPVRETLPVESLDAGSYLLSGPAMSGKYELLLSLATEGVAADEGVLFVTANEGAASVVGDLEERVGDGTERVRVVDCVSERQGSDDPPTDRVEYVASPADLTGIGIGVSEQLRRFDESGVDRTRVVFHSLSTLLMYAELETVFRFLHVLTGRVGTIEGLGAFAIDPTTHDASTVNTLKQLFDGMIELREADGDRQVRIVGGGREPTDWVAHP